MNNTGGEGGEKRGKGKGNVWARKKIGK